MRAPNGTALPAQLLLGVDGPAALTRPRRGWGRQVHPVLRRDPAARADRFLGDGGVVPRPAAQNIRPACAHAGDDGAWVHELRKKMVEEGRCTSAEFANLTESSREGGLNARVGPRRATARAAAAREPPLRARSQSTTFSTPSTWRVLAFGFSLGST